MDLCPLYSLSEIAQIVQLDQKVKTKLGLNRPPTTIVLREKYYPPTKTSLSPTFNVKTPGEVEAQRQI